MKNIRLFIIVCGVLFVVSGLPAMAEEGVAQTADQVIAASGGKDKDAAQQMGAGEDKKTEKVKEVLTDEQLAHKVELAKKMHQIRPTSEQIDAAIKQVAGRLPEAQRKGFIDTMSESLNYNAVERISIDAMVEVFTLQELESMVEYYSKPEAITASDKMADWAKIVQPEIARLIDKALMKIRMGE